MSVDFFLTWYTLDLLRNKFTCKSVDSFKLFLLQEVFFCLGCKHVMFSTCIFRPCSPSWITLVMWFFWRRLCVFKQLKLSVIKRDRCLYGKPLNAAWQEKNKITEHSLYYLFTSFWWFLVHYWVKEVLQIPVLMIQSMLTKSMTWRKCIFLISYTLYLCSVK